MQLQEVVVCQTLFLVYKATPDYFIINLKKLLKQIVCFIYDLEKRRNKKTPYSEINMRNKLRFATKILNNFSLFFVKECHCTF